LDLETAPYIGAGVNYTKFTSSDLPVGVTVDSSSTGAAFQLGVDVPLSSGMYLNFDVKQVYISTGVYSNGTKLGTFKIDPVLVGFGVGWRF
jgi:outer membrane protein